MEIEDSIMIMPVADEGNNRNYIVIVNGKHYEVLRGEATRVPLAVAYAIVYSAGAMEDKFVIGFNVSSSSGGGTAS